MEMPGPRLTLFLFESRNRLQQASEEAWKMQGQSRAACDRVICQHWPIGLTTPTAACADRGSYCAMRRASRKDGRYGNCCLSLNCSSLRLCVHLHTLTAEVHMHPMLILVSRDEARLAVAPVIGGCAMNRRRHKR